MIIIMIYNDNNIVVVVAGLDRQAGERERPTLPDHRLGLHPHVLVFHDLLGVGPVLAALVVFPHEVRLVCERREDAVDLIWL